MIAQEEGVGDALEGACVVRAGNERHVRPGSKCNHDVVVRKHYVARFGQGNANGAIGYVDRFNGALYESPPPKAWTYRLGAVTKLQYSRARLEEQGTEEE